MQSLLKDMKEFHTLAKLPIAEKVQLRLSPELRTRLQNLLEEESSETQTAIRSNDLIEIADGLADTIWVCVHIATFYGIPLDKVWTEVARTNMNKVNGTQGSVATRPDGKILKPARWTPPEIERIIREAM